MATRRRRTKKTVRRQPKYEFKPDRVGSPLLKKLVLTRQQQLRLAKWCLLSLVCLTALVVQDSMLSKLRLWGAATDLAVCAIFLVSLYEGTENGSLFALIASTVYVLAGSAPGPYSIAMITFLVVGLCLLRQTLWCRNFGSILLCQFVAVMTYEMGLFAIGLFTGRTILSRVSVFAVTGGLTCLTSLPLYPLIRRIGNIGGDPWKE